MAFISKFKTDTAYSNVDINEALSLITGQGVLPSSPNEILASVSESGVTVSDRRCEVIWADDEKNSVKICSGSVIMADGSYIIIYDEILPVPSSALSYVYIYNDIVRQNIPVCSQTLPDDNDSYILLATVENGKITDKRKLATSKIADFGTHPILKVSDTVTISNNTIPYGQSFLSVEVGEGYTSAIITEPEVPYIAIVNLETETFEKIMWRSSKRFDEYYKTLNLGTWLGQVSISYVDGVISLRSNMDLYSAFPQSYTFNFTVF